jgi:hypothetical protein
MYFSDKDYLNNYLNKTASYNSLLNFSFVVVASDLQKKTLLLKSKLGLIFTNRKSILF